MLSNNIKIAAREKSNSNERQKTPYMTPLDKQLAGILKKPKPKVNITEDKVASMYMKPIKKP